MNKLSSEYIFYFIYTLIIIFLVNKSFSNNYLENLSNINKNDFEKIICNEVEELKKNDIENLSKINEIVDEFYANNHVKFDKINISNNFNYLPIGCIIPFYGLSKDIPKGWLICNGKNGTPDLINRFILGKGNNYNINDTGGEKKVKLEIENLPEHAHTYSEAGNHEHGYYDAWTTVSHDKNRFKKTGYKNKMININDKNNYKIKGSIAKFSEAKYFPFKAEGAGYSQYNNETEIHKHSHELISQGGDEAHNNMPPYYELIYIIRVKI